MSQHRDDEDEVAVLQVALQAAVARLDALEEQQHREVRTKRVVVVDEEGQERVVLSSRQHTGSVLVQVPRQTDGVTGAELYASEAPDSSDDPALGIALWRDGDQAAYWSDASGSGGLL